MNVITSEEPLRSLLRPARDKLIILGGQGSFFRSDELGPVLRALQAGLPLVANLVLADVTDLIPPEAEDLAGVPVLGPAQGALRTWAVLRGGPELLGMAGMAGLVDTLAWAYWWGCEYLPGHDDFHSQPPCAPAPLLTALLLGEDLPPLPDLTPEARRRVVATQGAFLRAVCHVTRVRPPPGPEPLRKRALLQLASLGEPLVFQGMYALLRVT